MIRVAVALAAAVALACAQEEAVVGGPPSVTGTFGRTPMQIIIEMGKEHEYQARVAGVTVPVLYEVTRDCHRVSFDLPDARFSGCLGAQALVGSFRHPDGTIERAYLFRKP